MTIEFILLGVLLIYVIFYFDLKKQDNIMFFLAILFFMIGYFVKNAEFYFLSINFFNLFGLLYLIVYSLISIKNIKTNAIYGGMLIAILYILINYIKLDFNMFFDLNPIIFIMISVNFINCYTIKESILSSCLGIILCEIFNIFFMRPKLEFVAIFSEEIIVCVVFSVISIVVIKLLDKIVKGLRYEKGC